MERTRERLCDLRVLSLLARSVGRGVKSDGDRVARADCGIDVAIRPRCHLGRSGSLT